MADMYDERSLVLQDLPVRGGITSSRANFRVTVVRLQ